MNSKGKIGEDIKKTTSAEKAKTTFAEKSSTMTTISQTEVENETPFGDFLSQFRVYNQTLLCDFLSFFSANNIFFL